MDGSWLRLRVEARGSTRAPVRDRAVCAAGAAAFPIPYFRSKNPKTCGRVSFSPTPNAHARQLLNAPHNATWQGRKMRHPRVQRVHPCAHRPTHEEDSRGTNTQTHTRSPRSAKRPRMVCARDKERERGRRPWHARTTPPAPASAPQLAHTRTHASSDDAGAHAGDERSAPREEA